MVISGERLWEERRRLENGPAGAPAAREELLARLNRPLPESGVAAQQVVEDLIQDVRGGLMGMSGARFFGWVMGGATDAAVAADWLTTAWDQNAWLCATSPAAGVAEEVAGAWLKELLGLPQGASFAFVTGCQMAHVTCLAAARHAMLRRLGWDVEELGLAGAPELTVVTGEDVHGSVERAVQLLGLGRRSMARIPLTPGDLAQTLARLRQRPTVLVLQAGELNTGRFDDFQRLIPLAREHGAWVHIDGAFGLWVAVSERFRHLVSGIGEADSWATDGHKWLNVPFDSGYAFVREPAAHCGALGHWTPYQVRVEGAREPIDWTPEWSRRARGFTTYAAIRELGRAGIAALVERCSAHAHAIVTRAAALPGVEAVCVPVINQGLLRFGGSDETTDRVISRICASGDAFFGPTTYRGRRCMRVSVCSCKTDEVAIDRVLAAIAGAWQAERT